MKKFIALFLILSTLLVFASRDQLSGTLTTDGNTDFEWDCADKVTAIAFYGDFDGGDVTVLYEVIEGSGEYVAFADANAQTDDFGFQFKAPSSNLRITVANVTTLADITYVLRTVTE